MPETLSDGSKLYTIDGMPQKEGVPGYIGTFLKSWQNVQAIITSAEFSHEPIRVYYMVEAIISQIPDEEARKKIRADLDVRYKDTMEQFKTENDMDTLTKEDKSHCLVVAALRTLGMTTDYVDKHIGVSKNNRVGFVKRLDGSLAIYDGGGEH